MTEQKTNGQGDGPLGGLLAELPTDRLKTELEGFLGAAVGHGVKAVTGKLTGITEGSGPKGKALAAGARAIGEGKSPMRAVTGAGLAGLKDKVSQAFGGGKGGGGGAKIKVTNIVEQIDVGVPVRVAYNQWTQFRDFPTFMKKVEGADQEEDTELQWKAQILWSHRTWTSTIIEQVPDTRIVWRSEGDKGHVDGAVTFHEVTPDLTRILVVLEYHPQGLFERTGNLWRAQGRRVRLELKHFQRHVMTDTVLHPDDIEGWRGEIRDGEVVREPGEADEDEPGAEDEQEPEDAYDEDDDREPVDEEGAAADAGPEEYEDEPEGDEPEEVEDEYDEPSDSEELPEDDEEEEPAEEDQMEDEDAPADEVSERRQRAAEGR